jgi:hypothetical protein
MNSERSNQQWRPALIAGYRLSLWAASCSEREVGGGELLRAKDMCDAAPPPRCLAALHAHTVALHAANVALLHAVAAGPLAMPPAAATAAALLFALHPVHAESVATVYGRADVQSLLAQQLAVLATWHLRARAPALRALLALTLAALSTLSKENGIVTFALLPALEPLLSSSARRSSANAWFGVACASVAAAFLLARAALVTPWGPPFGFVDNPAIFVASRPARAASLAWLHFRYVEALLFPWRQSVNHGYDSGTLVLSIADARVALCGALYAAAAAVTGALGVRSASGDAGASRALACVLWGVLTFLPAANVGFSVGTTLGERLLYLPSAPAALLAALAAAAAARSDAVAAAGDALGAPPALRRAALLLSAPALLALLAARTRAELAPYGCDFTLWAAAVARYPGNLVAVNNLAVRLDTADAHAAALSLYDRIEASWADAERLAAGDGTPGGAVFVPGIVEGFSLAENTMRRSAMGRAAVLRPMLAAVAVDPAFYGEAHVQNSHAAARGKKGSKKKAKAGASAGAEPSMQSLDAAVSALTSYVQAIQGKPDPALGARMLTRVVALCERWAELQSVPLCGQAAGMLQARRAEQAAEAAAHAAALAARGA